MGKLFEVVDRHLVHMSNRFHPAEPFAYEMLQVRTELAARYLIRAAGLQPEPLPREPLPGRAY